MKERPTGIIRTLPFFGGIEKGENEKTMKRKAYARAMRSFRMMSRNPNRQVWVALAQKPSVEVLHFYLILDGAIRVRANIAAYEPGTAHPPVTCWDETIRQPKWWAILTGPVSFPPEPITRRGFQGFRYTGDLW